MLTFLTRLRRGAGALRPGTAVRPARDVITAEREGLAVLLDLRRDIYFSLDEVGTLIWRQIERGADVMEAVDRVCAEYDAAPELARQDVARFLDELVARGLVVTA